MPAVSRELATFQPIRLLIVITHFAEWATFIAMDNSDRDADVVFLNCSLARTLEFHPPERTGARSRPFYASVSASAELSQY